MSLTLLIPLTKLEFDSNFPKVLVTVDIRTSPLSVDQDVVRLIDHVSIRWLQLVDVMLVDVAFVCGTGVNGVWWWDYSALNQSMFWSSFHMSGSHSTWFRHSMLQCGSRLSRLPAGDLTVVILPDSVLLFCICICLSLSIRRAVGPTPNPQPGGPGVVLSLSLYLRPCQGPHWRSSHTNPSTTAKWQHMGASYEVPGAN